MNGLSSSIIVFVGPPGSGKGTLSQQCVKKFGWVQLSTGNLCRKAIAEHSIIGKEIEAALNSGRLVDDSLIGSLVEDWLDNQFDAGRTVILDGYPRVRTQAVMFDNFLKKKSLTFNLKVFHFVVPESIVVDRLSRRLVCQNRKCQAVYSSDRLSSLSSLVSNNQALCDACGQVLIRRPDDTTETVLERLVAYTSHEKELLDFYKSYPHAQVFTLSADDNVNSVFERFCAMAGAQAA